MINFGDLMSKLKKNLPEIAFALYCLRLISLGASIGDAIALISLVGIFGFLRFMDHKQIKQFDELKADIENMKSQHTKDMEDFKSAISSVKAAQGINRGIKTNEPQAQIGPKRYF